MTTGTSRFEQAYSRDMRTSGARSASDGVPPRAQNACGNGGPVSGPTRARQHVICISLRAHKTPCKCRLRHCAPTCYTPTRPRRHAVAGGLPRTGGEQISPAGIRKSQPCYFLIGQKAHVLNSRTQVRGDNGRTGARAADGARDRMGGGRGRQGPWTEGGTRNRKGGGRGRNAAVEGGRGKDQEEGGGTGPWKEGGARTRREGEERGRGRREARTRKAGGPGPTVGAEGGTVATRSSESLARTGSHW